ncbi:MAG TPA: hypothetical protein VGD81_06480 [Opitutaceae bacterium]
MRPLALVALCFSALTALAGPVPPELAAALAAFRAEGTRGWAFTQTTSSDGKSLVERFEPLSRGPSHWTLLQKDGRAPTESELADYRETQRRRGRVDSAPNVKDQIDPATCELVSDDGTRATWRFRLKPADADDRSAAHMAATFTLHRPTATIERVELANFEAFSPARLVALTEARTIVTYTLTEPERPTLLATVTTRIRGKALWIKSLDSDLTVTYSDYVYAAKPPPSPTSTP